MREPRLGVFMDVVIVESPAKAKTINKYLGPNYEVLASFGHVRDLPPKDGSVMPDDDFKMLWEIDAKAAKRLSDIAKAVKEADGVILATDPDLASPRGAALVTLLYLFECDEAVRLFRTA